MKEHPEVEGGSWEDNYPEGEQMTDQRIDVMTEVRVTSYGEARYWKAYMMYLAGLRDNEPQLSRYDHVTAERAEAIREHVEQVIEVIRFP